MAAHLVTGCAGFIGSHLTSKLLANGDQVIGIDDLSSGQQANLDLFISHPDFDFLQLDIATLNFHLPKLDYIWHLACPASPPRYQADPLKTLATCYTGTENILKLATEKQATILLASTSEIYGQPEQHPQPESYFGNVNTLGPRACYDEGKRIAETLAFNYWMSKGTKIKIARIFNTYGPAMRLDDGRVITNFIQQLLNKKPLTIYGDGSTTRSFCYVDDTVLALELIMASTGDYLYNVGNPNEITLTTLAQTVNKLFHDKPIELVYLERPQDDPIKRKPDISKIQSKLHWSPTTSLTDGLTKTIEHFRLCSSKFKATALT